MDGQPMQDHRGPDMPGITDNRFDFLHFLDQAGKVITYITWDQFITLGN
jgi:hypothetical protein